MPTLHAAAVGTSGRVQLRPSLSGAFSRPCNATPASARPSLVIRAVQSGGNKNGGRLKSGVEAMVQKYDFLSTGLGALSVTTYCVVFAHQDPVTALQITASSMIVGLVLNEVLFEDRS
mmetsp:Transcript_24007/g.42766  ORF Transcript_24007/g.42766 Transcript_24007/m.42766 type:complete len:118 (-) Transcript_24007:3-356(-)|eukprot:CAMPEP_0177762628 /NCGR_PEP_ID=MMETSP0491_2-20121128/6445_1 /TAXON_ID=63592 /ORGANISM="Tetraselmis chuii, Strain PLY429" /LENGTH=117 /DNA_ID=CAMNT_0019278693 /DNA_START=402 /DNA_END=755 /DNA_ORIENTATION=-